MRILFLDDQYYAHVEQNESGTLFAWTDTGDFFTDACDAYIEGYRVIPEGHTWTREDGMVFTGLMITPVDSPISLQTMQIKDHRQTIAVLDAAVVDLTYQNILLELGV